VYTAPGGSISTPFSCATSCGALYVNVTGTMTTHFFASLPVAAAVVTQSSIALTTDPAVPSNLTSFRIDYDGIAAGAHHIETYFGSTFSDQFSLGNEIRLPEPSAATNLGAGIVLLWAMGTVGARGRRRRA
jgi:hypothetical protein